MPRIPKHQRKKIYTRPVSLMRMPKQTSAPHILLYSKDFFIRLVLRRSRFWRIDFLLLGLGSSSSFARLVPILVKVWSNAFPLYWINTERLTIYTGAKCTNSAFAQKTKAALYSRGSHMIFPSMATYLRKKIANSPLIGQALVARRKGVGPKTKKAHFWLLNPW
jgi:hypothetical protein